ncbi:IclR family transcriptional regulator [Clavibacter michiganensis subsp. phaseoli]|uniref:IclR family transcriptional regulator n=1 Tax=Clavibacter phaseoli TaxID=1734031 RepID=UPI001FB4BBEF|nr:IclR family transcriptional regulator [Clavibacter phaseoli]MCJ1709692.1 IclR family transcriptional regulator [Clavibacter phaseoli]
MPDTPSDTPVTAAETSSSTVRSVDRALDLLELLERGDGPLRLVELSRGSGLQNATVLRILGSLQRRGWVTVEHGEYRVGPAALGIANGFLTTDRLSGRARPVLQQLADSTRLTASLYVRIGEERILTVRVDGEDPLRYQLPLGRRLPLHVGAGKNILAAFPEEERERVLAGLGSTDTAGGASVSVDALRDQLAVVRRDGFHISIDERETGVAAVSVPIHDRSGEVVAAISTSGPSETITRARLEARVPELRRAAAAVER